MKDLMISKCDAVKSFFFRVIIYHHRVFHLIQSVEYGFMRVRIRPFRKFIAHVVYRLPREVYHIKIIFVFGVKSRIHAGSPAGLWIHDHAGGLPEIMIAQCKYQVGHVLCGIFPGIEFILFRDILFLIRTVDHVNDGIIVRCVVDPADDLFRKYLLLILQFARGPYHVIFRHSDACLEIAKVIIKLFRAAVRIFIPAVHIVIYGHAREKVCDEIRAVFYLPGAHVGSFVESIIIYNA